VSQLGFVLNGGSVRARREEIVHCDLCGGIVFGPRDYDVAICYCPRPKSEGKALPRQRLEHRPDKGEGLPEHPSRLDHAPDALPWDSAVSPDK
jgi:hypothetical protein